MIGHLIETLIETTLIHISAALWGRRHPKTFCPRDPRCYCHSNSWTTFFCWESDSNLLFDKGRTLTLAFLGLILEFSSCYTQDGWIIWKVREMDFLNCLSYEYMTLLSPIRPLDWGICKCSHRSSLQICFLKSIEMQIYKEKNGKDNSLSSTLQHIHLY